jgi:hypothetical protein
MGILSIVDVNLFYHSIFQPLFADETNGRCLLLLTEINFQIFGFIAIMIGGKSNVIRVERLSWNRSHQKTGYWSEFIFFLL